jgi:hypothetical protein
MVQVLKRSKFLCSPLVISTLSFFQICQWNTRYIFMVGFLQYLESQIKSYQFSHMKNPQHGQLGNTIKLDSFFIC